MKLYLPIEIEESQPACATCPFRSVYIPSYKEAPSTYICSAPVQNPHGRYVESRYVHPLAIGFADNYTVMLAHCPLQPEVE